MNELKRAELITALARIGVIACVKQGMFDALLGGDEPGSPAVALRLAQLQDIAAEQGIHLEDLDQVTDLMKARLTNAEQNIGRNSNTLRSVEEELELADTAIDQLNTAQLSIKNQLSSVDTSVNSLLESNASLLSRVQTTESVNSFQDAAIESLEDMVTGNAAGGLKDLTNKLSEKADLEDGKIPLSQLPELPTGRKVTVEDATQRLTLTEHSDITIAYQQDNGVGYILGAGADPSLSSNWQPLTNTQVSGITSFNSRTGVVSPAPGDYTTAMVTPTAERGYVSPTDRSRWDVKATPESVEAFVGALRTEISQNYVAGNAADFLKTSDTTVVKRSELGIVSGVATLGADGKVLTSQLPPLGLTSAQLTRLTNVESLAAFANEKGDRAAENSVVLDSRLSAVEASGTSLTNVNNKVISLEAQQVDTDSAIVRIDSLDVVQNTRLTELEAKAATAGIPYSEKDTASGVAPLDSSRKVPLVNLPTFLPQSARIYRDVLASRSIGNWVTNTSKNEMIVHLRSKQTTSASFYLRSLINDLPNASASNFVIRSGAQNTTNSRWLTLTLYVPAGWRYQITGDGGVIKDNIETWYEFS